MIGLAILAGLPVLALLAPLWGADTRDWSGWRRTDDTRQTRCSITSWSTSSRSGPAAGSAALGLGGWLAGDLAGDLAGTAVLTGDGTHAYDITQGVELGRPSLLCGDVTVASGQVSRVRVSGRVAPVASGRIRVP